MKFSVVASFTLRPPERVYDFMYRCLLEPAPTPGEFQLSVHKVTYAHGAVLSRTLRCAPDSLHDEVRKHVEVLHRDRTLALGSFEPKDVWLKVSA